MISAQPLHRVKRNAIVTQTDYLAPVSVDQPQVNTAGMPVSKAVLHDIPGHFLHKQGCHHGYAL